MFFAGQKPDISAQLTLRQLAAYPQSAGAFDDEALSRAFVKAGLEEYLPFIDERIHSGKPWQGLLSGGQEQKLVLARILLNKPDILFLDEATSAMSPAVTKSFFQTIRQELPQAIVQSIMHVDRMPLQEDGRVLFDQIMHIKDGRAVVYPGYMFSKFSAPTAAKEDVKAGTVRPCMPSVK